MKRKNYCIILLSLAVLLTGCVPLRPAHGSLTHLRRDTGFEIKREDITELTEIYYNFGGLSNDGILYFQMKTELDLPDESWDLQPLSESAVDFLDFLTLQINVTIPQNYYWKLVDRTPEDEGPLTHYTDTSLLIYDTDTGILHWIYSKG